MIRKPVISRQISFAEFSTNLREGPSRSRQPATREVEFYCIWVWSFSRHCAGWFHPLGIWQCVTAQLVPHIMKEFGTTKTEDEGKMSVLNVGEPIIQWCSVLPWNNSNLSHISSLLCKITRVISMTGDSNIPWLQLWHWELGTPSAEPHDLLTEQWSDSGNDTDAEFLSEVQLICIKPKQQF